MKAKLIKRSDNSYKLYVNGETFATTDNNPYKKLSLKNCQAIENGYDLEELALEVCDCEANECDIRDEFKAGFQKAIEILGDKKFSEEAIEKAIEKGMEIQRTIDNTVNIPYTRIKEYIKSIQQKEWDVEVVMECPQCQEWGYVNECRVNCNKKFLQPKLDKDNCLILKRP